MSSNLIRRRGYRSVTVPAIPEIVAHRGYSFAAPENTVAAFELAWKVAADAVEIDIYLTADNHIVVHHCATTGRTCVGGDLKVSESTLEELRKLDAGQAKGAQWAGEKIPTLEETFAVVPDGKRLLVEIKCHSEIVPEFMRIFKASGLKDEQVAIISFHDDVIKTIKEVHPSFEAYWLCCTNRMSADELVATAKAANADGLDAMVCDEFNEEFVAKVREAGMGLHVWTVDKDEEAVRMAALGVDGITTNRPAEIRALLEGRR
jgi:glycerophosphoryl diester phosphodiesterase